MHDAPRRVYGQKLVKGHLTICSKCRSSTYLQLTILSPLTGEPWNYPIPLMIMQALPRPAASMNRLVRARSITTLQHPRSIRIQARLARPLSSARSVPSTLPGRRPDGLVLSGWDRCYTSTSTARAREAAGRQPGRVEDDGLDGWETIIGLEIHAQIRTSRKLFSGKLDVPESFTSGC